MDCLPIELIYIIFEYVWSAKDVALCSFVCSKWRAMVKSFERKNREELFATGYKTVLDVITRYEGNGYLKIKMNVARYNYCRQGCFYNPLTRIRAQKIFLSALNTRSLIKTLRICSNMVLNDMKAEFSTIWKVPLGSLSVEINSYHIAVMLYGRKIRIGYNNINFYAGRDIIRTVDKRLKDCLTRLRMNLEYMSIKVSAEDFLRDTFALQCKYIESLN